MDSMWLRVSHIFKKAQKNPTVDLEQDSWKLKKDGDIVR